MVIFAILKKTHMFNLKNTCILLLSLVLVGNSFAQTNTNQDDRADEVQLNTITTAVPFLMIGPDARGGGFC